LLDRGAFARLRRRVGATRGNKETARLVVGLFSNLGETSTAHIVLEMVRLVTLEIVPSDCREESVKGQKDQGTVMVVCCFDFQMVSPQQRKFE
jgi:hypothetical protein